MAHYKWPGPMITFCLGEKPPENPCLYSRLEVCSQWLKMEGSLQIPVFNLPPSSLDFDSAESRNVPAVLTGCIKNWRALSNWDPSNGGLDYLQERVGSCTVEAMLSRYAPVFYGDIRSHERVPLPFSSFVAFCKKCLHNKDVGDRVCYESERHRLAGSDTEQSSSVLGDAPEQIYLAQVPIMNVENDDRVQLATLIEDIQTPAFLETKALASINLWMNSTQARSSTHFDPHHNLLCIVAGCKQVVLWPPSAIPSLYPMPIYGEASNHSSVALEEPDFSIHPRAKHSMKQSHKVILQAGDAVFIPEGWFHQVDSNDLTIAVNFWWRSNLTSSLSEHMDAYYLRRILRRLTDREMNRLLGENSSGLENMEKHSCELPNNGESDNHESDWDQKCAIKDLKGNKLKQKMLHEMDPFSLQILNKIIALVHDSVKVGHQTDSVHSTSEHEFDVGVKGEQKRIVASNLFHLEDDQLAQILWTLEPFTLQNVFLAMVHNFPRTLEALTLHLLSPVGAEVLTRKFEQLDRHITEEERNEFYSLFYGVFDDQFAAMKSILDGKESFAYQAFKNVLDQYLGVNHDGPKPLFGSDTR